MAPNATSAGCPETTLIETELLDGVAVIALNRPEKRNAINDAMRADLIQVLDWVIARRTYVPSSSPGAARGSAPAATSPP